MATRNVIVGAGVAGLAAAETLRSLDGEAGITLVGNEAPYARMVLPYWMEGRIKEGAIETGSADYFAERGFDTRFGESVAALDPAGKRLTLEGGEALDYDSLLLATGSHAARPPIPGADGRQVLALWTREDARAFLDGPHHEVAIVGAGFIASTILDAVVKRADKVHLIEIEEQILPRMVDSSAAALVEAHLREKQIEIHAGAEVTAIEDAGARKRISLASGAAIDVDVVILATGIRPNLGFLEGSGVEIDAGVLVDGHMQSSAASIYAAGDVAQGPVLNLPERRVHAIQPTAVDHGRVAAANMLGNDVRYEGSLLMNIVATQGLEMASFGLWEGAGHPATVVENERGRIYRKYVWEDDRLVGGILVGPTHAMSGQNDVGMLKGLVQTGASLGPWRKYLQENPLDLRRLFVASGAATQLAESTLLSGRASLGGGFRFKRLAPRRPRSAHHAAIVANAPRPA
jgi:NAD(P)H-nitrite reductase large subunit